MVSVSVSWVEVSVSVSVSWVLVSVSVSVSWVEISVSVSVSWVEVSLTSLLIRRKIANKSKEGMLILYKTLVRPIVDYCTPVWRPYLRKDVNKIEKIQKRFTKMLLECRGKIMKKGY